jgi:hypothetical protein
MDTPEAEKSPGELFNEAIALSNEIKFAEAADRLRYILGRYPGFSQAFDALALVLSNLAVTHGRTGDTASAAACLIESLCLAPGREDLRAMLAGLLNDKARDDIRDLRPADGILALGRSLRVTGDPSPDQQDLLLEALSLGGGDIAMPGMSWAEKVDLLERVIARTPDAPLPRLIHMVAVTEYCAQAHDGPELKRALPKLFLSAGYAKWLLADGSQADNPTFIFAVNVLAGTLCRYEKPDAALELEDGLRHLDSGRLEIHQNKMFASLYKGDLDTAWCRENWDALNEACDLPMWDGRTPGEVIHLVNNNGMGDFLQSIRHIPALSAFFDEIHIWDRAFGPRGHRHQIGRLLARSKGFEKVRLHPGAPQLASGDAYCELFALPFALHATRADYSAPPAYLSADPDLVARWSALVRKPGRLSVAFAWSMGGDPRPNGRNFGIADFAALFECDARIDFYSIQNNSAKFDLLPIDRPPNVTDLGIVDLEHMAALMNSVDVVIAPDCGLAHIAGATGAPLWVGVHRYCDWRWRGTGSRQGLYSSARMFRQPAPGDWASVLGEMRAALVALAEAL